MATSAELGIKLNSEREAYASWLASHKAEDGSYDLTGDQVTEFHTRNDAVAEMQKSYETALMVEKSAAEVAAKLAPQGRMVAPEAEESDGRIKSPEQLDRAFKSAFRQHGDALKSISAGSRGTVRFEIPVEAKTLVTLSDHYPQATRAASTGMANYYGDVESLFTSGSTNANNVEYFVQTTNTTNAAFVAEGNAATDSAYVWTKVTDEVETIQAWIPVTREFLADNAGMQSMVSGMLAYELAAEVSQQLLSGTGTTPQLWGAIVRTGFQTQAKGTDPAFDAIGKAIKLVQVTGDATPDAIVLHPTDWWNLRLTRTSDGVYILGNPADAGPLQLWGLPVRLSTGTTTNAAAGTAAVGAFKQYAQIFNHGGITVEASSEHSTYFTERKVALAVSRRMSVIHTRPSAFAKITGL